MGRKGNLAIFESSSISKTGEATATKIGVHAFDINPYLPKIFGPIPIDWIFCDHGIIVHGSKGKFGCFESDHKGAKSTETSQYHQISKSSELSVSFGNFINRDFDFQMIIIWLV